MGRPIIVTGFGPPRYIVTPVDERRDSKGMGWSKNIFGDIRGVLRARRSAGLL
jgi:hypothetical protein